MTFHVIGYHSLRDSLSGGLERRGWHVHLEESIRLDDAAKQCVILVFPPEHQPEEVRAEVSFEWMAADQTTWEDISLHLSQDDEEALDDLEPESNSVYIHIEFQMMLDQLPVTTDHTWDVTQRIQAISEEHFEGGGTIVAQVMMTSREAGIETMVLHHDVTRPILSEDEWWDELAASVADIMHHWQSIYFQLEDELRAG